MVCTNLKTMNKHCPKLKWTRKKPCHHLTGKPTHYALIVGFPRGSTPADLFLPSNKTTSGLNGHGKDLLKQTRKQNKQKKKGKLVKTAPGVVTEVIKN